MKYKICLLVFFVNFIICRDALGQDPEAFNRIYQSAYLEIAPKNPERALAIADSLFKTATEPKLKVKSLMLSATLYQQQQKLSKSTALAEQALSIIEGTDDYNWKVRICGFLATHYRHLQLYKKSKILCDRALQMIPLITHEETAQGARGLVNQELAYYDITLGNYTSAISHIKTSQQSFDKIVQNKEYLTGNNEQLLGLCYFHLGDYNKSLNHYNRSLRLMRQFPDNEIKGLLYNGMSSIYIEKKDLVTAKLYLDSASAIMKTSKYLQLKSEILKTTQNYYLKAKDLAHFEEARKKQDSVREQINLNSTKFLDSSFIQLEKKQEETASKSKAKNIPLAAGCVVIVFGAGYFYLYRRKQQQKYNAFMAHFEDKKTPVLFDATTSHRPTSGPATASADDTAADPKATLPSENREEEALQEPVKKTETTSLLTEETLQRLLKSLEKFEAQQLFTSGTITLSQLAAHLNTNTKYLSYVIKKYKERDFNSYVNELRIDYIIRKLKDNPEWRSYKISVLAERAGFSSHGKFATIFKGVTGLSPSVFIQHLNNEDKAQMN